MGIFDEAFRENPSLYGGYELSYRLWLITFPYFTKKYLFSGAKADAITFADGIKTAKAIPYKPSIREIKV